MIRISISLWILSYVHYFFTNSRISNLLKSVFFSYLRHQVLFNGSLHILIWWIAPQSYFWVFVGDTLKHLPVEARGSLLRSSFTFQGQVSSCFSCWFWKIAHWSCSSDPLMVHGKEHIPVEDEMFLSQLSIFQLPCLLITHSDDTAIKSIPHSIPSYPNSFSLYHH